MHHDRLKAVKEGNLEAINPISDTTENCSRGDSSDDSSTTIVSSGHSDYSPSDNGDYSASSSDTDVDESRRYPIRQRRNREIPGAIPWDSINL